MEDKKRKLLENNLSKINDFLSKKLEIKTNLQIIENTSYRNETYFTMIDKTNIREMCGVMRYAFENVYISTFNIWFDDDLESATLDFHFCYEHIDGGENGAHFCMVIVENGNIAER